MTALGWTEGGYPAGPEEEGLPLADMHRLISACDRFEDGWRGGGRPDIEAFLPEVAESERAGLFRRLIAIEVEARRSRGEDPVEAEYLARFPGEVQVVRSALKAGRAAEGPGAAPRVSDAADGAERDTEGGDGPPAGPRAGGVEVTADRAAALSDEQTDSHPVGPPLPMPVRIGRYRVRRLLGEGGFGRVYHARDEELGRDVAVKVPRAGAFVSPRHADAFVHEARLAASLKHPAIVTVHDIGHDEDGSLFVVLEYVEGQSLSDLLRSEAVTHRRLAELMALVAEALHYAHSRGLIHRDLKPANLLIDRSGRPHVTDFGLAVHEAGVRALGRQVAGTLHYMAPEQVRGESHRLDGRTDLWGLGVVLYQMLTGRLPFQGRERSQVFDEIVRRDPVPPRQLDPGLPQDLERICLKCLSKRMSDRYPTALELAADLWFWVARAGKASGSVAGTSAPGQVAVSATTVDTESGSWQPRVRVVPKGLRSFDASDGGFFRALLPGPFDRDGLPECLRFWKTRIDSTDPDEAFPVGLLFGPSGSGKSSLIKAGLIPHLARHVKAVYLEATPDGTDARLLRGLRKACPGLPEGLSPAEGVQAAREDLELRRGKKLLLVVDQFEQWLHARRPGRGDSMVEALRQCDGVSVQSLVMARDDFGTAAMRFMNALEVPLVEGKNCALVDRFDPLHAAAVLTLYGRALGRLPGEGPPTADQRRFLDQAVAGMVRNGKVAPVRLALFVEMFRGKPWDPASLKRVGGADGIGALFLEEALGPAAPNPRRQAHREPARAVLRALLPAPGVNIRGHMKPYATLLAASGYSDRPAAFDDLIQVLDGDLRLITPCDPEKGDPESARAGGPACPGSDVPVASRSFQLTHDYLVPSLRKWLTQTQSETARGRAALLLEDRASVWVGRPGRRYLPTPLEWARIALTTRRADWTPDQDRMMRSALRSYLTSLVVAGLLIAALAGAGVRVAVWREIGRREKPTQTSVRVMSDTP